jgi:hypothetical protein
VPSISAEGKFGGTATVAALAAFQSEPTPYLLKVVEAVAKPEQLVNRGPFKVGLKAMVRRTTHPETPQAPVAVPVLDHAHTGLEFETSAQTHI